MTSQDFLLYMLKISLLAGLFLGYYWIALRNKRFHYYNRFYLLASIVFSLLIPLLRFDWITTEQPVFMGSGASIDLIATASSKSPTSSINFSAISLIFIQVVSLLLLLTICYKIFKIYQIKKQSQITKLDGFDLMHTDEDSAPFSFLNNLFWKRSISIDDEGGKQIFKHELTHIQQKHTWDRLFTQLFCSIFWINPFYWLIQKELETIHEFIADEAAVANHDVESFAKMLLQAHYGNHFFETKHSFFYSSIKRRLTMLTTTTNTRFSYVRRVMLLPLLLIGISIFSVRVQAKEKIEKKMTGISETIFPKKIDTTKPPPPPPSLNEKIKTTKALVFVDGKEANKAELANSLKPIEVIEVRNLKREEALKKYGNKAVNGVIEISTISKVNSKKQLSKTDEERPMLKIGNELIMMDGEVVEKTILAKQLSSKNIATINLLTPQDALLKYGNIGNKGVVEVKLINGITANKESYDKVFTAVQTPAQFPGGLPAWTKYLERNLNRDIPVNNGAPPGKYTAVVSFIVDKNGSLSDIKTETDPGFGTAEEAKRMISKGPSWVPAIQNGKKVVYRHKQSITFQITEE